MHGTTALREMATPTRLRGGHTTPITGVAVGLVGGGNASVFTVVTSALESRKAVVWWSSSRGRRQRQRQRRRNDTHRAS